MSAGTKLVLEPLAPGEIRQRNRTRYLRAKWEGERRWVGPIDALQPLNERARKALHARIRDHITAALEGCPCVICERVTERLAICKADGIGGLVAVDVAISDELARCCLPNETGGD